VYRRPKIRFFGKIGFLTVHRHSKIRFFGKIGFLTVGMPARTLRVLQQVRFAKHVHAPIVHKPL
jgi:hypothetical protein